MQRIGGKVEYKLLHENSGQRTFVVVLSTGEEVLSSLNDFLQRENVHAAQLTAIGALSELVLMYFDWDKKDYLRIPMAWDRVIHRHSEEWKASIHLSAP